MRPSRRGGSIAAILMAGVIAYFAYAAGDAGPMVAFGRGDANYAAASAWMQLPIHAAIALGLAVAGPTAVRWLAWAASCVALVAMSLFAAYLMTAQLRYLGDSADLLDAAVSAILLVLYVGALALSTATVRSEPVRSS